MNGVAYVIAWIIVVVCSTLLGCLLGLIIRNQYLGG